MKTHKVRIRYISIAILALALGSMQSCVNEDFLDEELETARSTEYYKSEEGILSLAQGGYYRVIALPFGGEMQSTSTNYGTDEFVIGGDDSNRVWNNYDSGLQSSILSLNSNTVSAERQFDDIYLGIHIANQIVKYATDIESTNPAIKQTALGEGYFFRGFSYLRLVRQYGGVPIKLNVSTTVESEFTRATPKEVYDQVIADLTEAYNILPNTGGPAKITKDAAAHYLAKAYLSRASEMNDDWNSATKQADLNQVVTLSNEVIANHPLAANYKDLWNYTAPDGANETLPEIILSAQFTDDLGATATNFSSVVFTSKYDDLPFMKRDLTGMRPYSRLAPSYFTYEVYNVFNDSRIWKSFRTKHRVNNASGTTYVNGDLGIMYVLNDKNDNSFTQTKYLNTIVYGATGKTIPSVYVAHSSAATTLLSEPRFPSLSKHFDASRLTVNETRGFRDEILARSADTYLLAAEAKVRLAALGSGSYNDALTYINAVRQRAAFKSGEVRSAYVDGGAAYPTSALAQPAAINSYFTENSYFESTHLAPTTDATDLTITSISSLPAEDEAVISRLGYSGDYKRMLCLVLNERTRELCGEWHRWEDLARTKTLVERVRAYNPTAAGNIQDHHMLRPIPQTFLDLITSGGSPLSAAQKQAMQNPGY
jgi:starch-binding outer membrane protein, SusD/RagB family